MSKILLIGIILILVWIRLILPFIRDVILSDKGLEYNPIQERFRYLLESLDKSIFDGKGIVTVYDENKKFMQMSGNNSMGVSYCFMYSTKNLTVEIIFENNHSGSTINRQYNQVDGISESGQIYIAKEVEEVTRHHYQSLMS